MKNQKLSVIKSGKEKANINKTGENKKMGKNDKKTGKNAKNHSHFCSAINEGIYLLFITLKLLIFEPTTEVKR